MKNNNILITINLDEGLYNFRVELIEALIQEGYKVHLALPFGEYREKLEALGCTIHNTPLDRRGTDPFKELNLIRCYNRILNTVKPAAVLTYTIKPNIYMGWLCGRKAIPYITTITGLGTAVYGNGPLQSLTKFMYKMALKKASAVFFQNEDNMKLFEKLGIAPQKHRLIPGSGVNLQRFSLMPYPEKDAAEFLFISRIMKEKGIKEYISAAGIIKKKHPDVIFRVLGFLEDDYEDKEEFEKAVSEGIIVYEGSVPDVREYLKNAECTIHPSYYPEGMSNVCLESAACGRAVITTDRTGCRDTVKDGLTGFIVKERDSEALAARIEEFLSMPREDRKAMGLKGREYMEERFDRRLVSREMVNAILTLT